MGTSPGTLQAPRGSREPLAIVCPPAEPLGAPEVSSPGECEWGQVLHLGSARVLSLLSGADLSSFPPTTTSLWCGGGRPCGAHLSAWHGPWGP